MMLLGNGGMCNREPTEQSLVGKGNVPWRPATVRSDRKLEHDEWQDRQEDAAHTTKLHVWSGVDGGSGISSGGGGLVTQVNRCGSGVGAGAVLFRWG